VWRQGLKLGVFFALSFLIANVFLAYIIGSDALWTIVTDPPRQHLAGLVAITIFSLVFFAVFARFREQACVLACPYGRIMSSIIDRHTITVTYDTTRGEPRGRLTREAGAPGSPRGDCVDCHQCVTVCPTGIDIRNGVQLECVNCTACMDACDDVMQRVGRPTGLIRLTSHEAVADGRLRWLTARVKAYATVWIVLIGVVTWIIASRASLDVVVLRQPGTLFAELPDGSFANFYNVQIFNRTRRDVPFEIVPVEPAGLTVAPLGPMGEVAAHGLLESRLLLTVPAGAVPAGSVAVRLEVRAGGEVVQQIRSALVGRPAGRAGGRDDRQPDRGDRERDRD
jgi:cytochrome c oxidase accessory protein FixG